MNQPVTPKRFLSALIAAALLTGACENRKAENQTNAAQTDTSGTAAKDPAGGGRQPIAQPLLTDMYTADPSAHVFNGRVYIYPSHDIEAGIPSNDNGDHFAMRDYHVLSLDSVGGKVTDHGVALDIKDIAWAGRQLWAPDAAFANNQYYLYFPVKDKKDVFRIGVATSASPTGPFKAQPKPIEGSYSIDPAVFGDADGKYYLYFGGIWGGQLQRWQTGKYDSTAAPEPSGNGPAIGPRVARLGKNMLGFAEPVREIQIVDSTGKPIPADDHNRRFFEAAWVHKHKGKYYFSYSTGDTHFIAYATGDSPYGPFTYRGVVLNPVEGWTNHHSIVEVKGKWYLFYHDTQRSGQTHLRDVKVTELTHRPDGTIATVTAYQEQ
ncbi:MAG: glycoside hydrolase family 43 protein [Cytophagales bacterium]|nr:glycoside hydrolase family 43 protein [Cytophagales bacterium]